VDKLFFKFKINCLENVLLGETPILFWVKHRVYPQISMGETPCLSTDMGETPIVIKFCV